VLDIVIVIPCYKCDCDCDRAIDSLAVTSQLVRPSSSSSSVMLHGKRKIHGGYDRY